MNTRSKTLLLSFLVLLAVVLAVSYWPARTNGPDLKVPGWSPGKKIEKAEEEGPIDRLDVEAAGHKVTLARGEDKKWSLTPPEGARADKFKVRMAVELFQEDVASVVSSVPRTADLPAFGLDDANRVRVTAYQGTTPAGDLELGTVQKSETGYGEGDTFVRVPGQERVYRVIGKDLRRAFVDGLKGFRDKRVFDWDAADATAVEVSNPGAADEVDRAIRLASDEKPAPEGTPKDPAKKYTTTWFDMFRLESGKIAEHWDPAPKL